MWRNSRTISEGNPGRIYYGIPIKDHVEIARKRKLHGGIPGRTAKRNSVWIFAGISGEIAAVIKEECFHDFLDRT